MTIIADLFSIEHFRADLKVVHRDQSLRGCSEVLLGEVDERRHSRFRLLEHQPDKYKLKFELH